MRGIDLCHLMDGDYITERVETRPTKLFRPRDSKKAELGHLLDVLPGKFLRSVESRRHWCDLLVGELPHHLANCYVLLAEVMRIVDLVSGCFGFAGCADHGEKLFAISRELHLPDAPHLRQRIE